MHRTFSCLAACLSVWIMHCRPETTQTNRADAASGIASETTTPGREPPSQALQGRCSHRGPVEIRPISPENSREISARFQQRNGHEWRVKLDRFGTYVRSASRTVDASAVGPAVAVPADQAKEMALDLVRKNADLFGLSAPELASLFVELNPGPPGTLVQWDVEVSGKWLRPGYEQFHTVAKDVRLVVTIQRDGVVRAVSSKYEYLPPFKLCTDPLLTAEDPKVRASVLGKELGYSVSAGQPVSAGKVEPGDIRSTTLTIWPRRQEASTTLHLVYDVHVEKGHEWSFLVDADTGQLIAEFPMFVD